MLGQDKAHRFAKQNEGALQASATAGWAAKGALYVTLGVLAVMAAVGSGGKVSGGKGILDWVAGQPFGQVLLVLAGVGFAGYALWRLAMAALDPEYHSSTKKMVAKRIGWAASGAAHISLAVAAFQLLNGGSSGGSQRRMWLDEALRESWGPWLVGAIGLFIVGVGLYQFKKAFELGFMDDVKTHEMSSAERSVLKKVGRIGLAARGVVFPIIGGFLVKAAIEADPSEAKGVGGALGALAQAGTVWLIIVALGLAAYGVLNLFFAKYRTVDI